MIVKIAGGLGNQMFQYAVAKAVSLKMQQTLYLDTTWFIQHRSRDFELHNYRISYKKAAYATVIWHKVWKRIFTILNLRNRYWVYDEDDTFLYDDSVFHKKYSYLMGYFQNPEYFRSIRDVLQREFVLSNQVESGQGQLIQKLQSTESVAVHVRRGDYVSENHSSLQKYIVQDVDYYHRAFRLVSDKISEPEFYIFSDDIDWCKKNFDSSIYHIHFIDSSLSNSVHDDFLFMRSCRHFILANSTFSWWAAWLSHEKGRLVVVPERWYMDTNKNAASKVLVEKDWFVL